MLVFPHLGPPSFWQQFTRLGEAQILLPAALLGAVVLLRHGQGRLAVWWLGLIGAAASLTTLTKVAFIGWGVGSPALDFTGISGHAMFAAAVYPMLMGMLVSPARRLAHALAIGAGAVLAAAVGVSRVIVQAHSSSEVVAGLLVGAAVCVIALARERPPPARIAWLAPVVLAWFAALPAVAPPSQTHAMVTRLALALSGRSEPFTREALWREQRVLLRRPALL